MTNEKIIQVTELYEHSAMYLNTADHDHVRRMCPEIRRFVAEGRREKAMRWLGFVQGLFYASRWYTIEDLKRHVMPDGATFKEDAT